MKCSVCDREVEMLVGGTCGDPECMRTAHEPAAVAATVAAYQAALKGEFVEESDSTAAYARALQRYERVLTSDRVAWRTYAAAALEGLIAGGHVFEGAIPRTAACHADAMLDEERKRFGHGE